MNIYLQSSSGKHNFPSLMASTTIKSIKSSIISILGIPYDQQCLIFHGKELEDDKTLADLKICSGNIIHLELISNMNFQIFIRLSDKIISLTTKYSDRIDNIKQKINEREGTPIEMIHLSYCGKKLFFNDFTLLDYGIFKESTLELMWINNTAKVSNKATINISLPNGEIFTKEMKISRKVFELKKKTQDKLGIHWDNQRLFFLNNELEDDKYLSDYTIKCSQKVCIYLIKVNSPRVIYVKMPRNDILTLDLYDNLSIVKVKELIRSTTKISLDQQQLYIANQELNETKLLEGYNVQDRSTIYLILNKPLSDPVSKSPMKEIIITNKKCSKCNDRASWRCECSNISLCNNHRLDHLMAPIPHNIQWIKSYLSPESSSKVKESILTKIKFIEDFSNKIQQETNLLISKISELSDSAIQSLNESKNMYLQLLQMTNRKLIDLEIEELKESCLSKLSPYKSFVNINHCLGIISDFYKENFLIKTPYKFAREEHEIRVDICTNCSKANDIKFFSTVCCLDAQECNLCTMCRLLDPNKCVKCNRNYGQYEKELVSIVRKIINDHHD